MLDIWIIYLRKSRQDDPNETVEEVLAKHEAMLQEYALRELGHTIPEENIYREIVSGESIDDRVEIKKVLARIEDPAVKGVLVIEPQRLSRGDLEDCGRLINSFRFTHTQIGTPMMTYDLENKMERKFFQDELLRGRDYLEYTKEILWRGRIASVKRGCYIGNYAPYGYKKIKIGKDNTLEIIEEEAEVVRMVYRLYVEDQLTPYQIAVRLTGMGIKAPRKDVWHKDTIRHMIRNAHYDGKVVFNKIKLTSLLEDGEIVKRKMKQEDEDILIVEGKHPAIIDHDLWEAAQALVARNPRKKHTHELRNPYSGMLYCGKCGYTLHIHPYKHARDRYECRSRPRCYKSVPADEVDAAILFALEQSELPELQLKVKNGDGDAVKIQQKLLAKLEKQMEEYRDQEEKQFDLLETGRYTQDLFDRRNAALRVKMEDCQKQIYQAKKTMPQNVDYVERVATLQAAIEALKDPDMTPKDKNKLLRRIVERIELYGQPSTGLNTAGPKGLPAQFSLKVFLRL